MRRAGCGVPPDVDVRPMLAGTELPQVQELTTNDLRALAEHKAPGKDGAVKSTLAVNHDSLADEPARDRVKAWWKEVLAELAAEMKTDATK